MLRFVDDKNNYLNNILKQLQQTIIEAMQQSIRFWDEILTFVEGKLEMSKYNCCILDWIFDKSDKPILNNNKETITFLTENNIQVHSQQLSPKNVITYLGVISQPNGKQNAISSHIRQVVDSLSRTITSIHLPHYYAHIFHQWKVNPKLNYSLATTSMFDEQINSIHRRIHPEVFYFISKKLKISYNF